MSSLMCCWVLMKAVEILGSWGLIMEWVYGEARFGEGFWIHKLENGHGSLRFMGSGTGKGLWADGRISFASIRLAKQHLLTLYKRIVF